MPISIATVLIASATLALSSFALSTMLATRARARATEAERKYRAIVEAAPLGFHFWRVDEEGELVFDGANPAADRLLGISHSSLVGKRMGEAFPPLMSTEIPARYKAAAVDGTPWHTEQVEYADGKIAGAFEVNAFGSGPGGMVAVFSDITGRKRDEAALAAEKAFSEILIESLPGIFYLYSYPDLKLIRWNRNHERLLGFGAEELMEKSILDWHPETMRQGVRDTIDRDMEGEGGVIEGGLIGKAGVPVPFLLTSKPFLREGKRYLVGFGIEIAELQAARDRLVKANAELESRVEERTAELTLALAEARDSKDRAAMAEKMAALGHLVAGLAHELNTPLGAILSANESCAQGVHALPQVLALRGSLADADRQLFDSLLGAALAGDWARDAAEFRTRRRRVVATLEAAGVPAPELVGEKLAESGFGADGEALEAA
ncbi:MAG TPA: PAS domain S-box protein, partial [Spirochaetales bacterium]|nr:PAS domain S-box protein [Spirochaetales bacterium]